MKLLTMSLIPAVIAFWAAAIPAGPARAAHDTRLDDPPPIECPLCGGDATLHAKRVNWMALTQTRLAYRLLRSMAS